MLPEPAERLNSRPLGATNNKERELDTSVHLRDREIKLYELIVDQLHRYGSIIWQLPTALVAANLLAFQHASHLPLVLIGIALFNGAMIYVLHRMTTQQRALIEAARNAEAALGVHYPGFVPSFARAGVSAPRVLLATMVVLDAGLFLFAYGSLLICPYRGW